MYKNQSAFNKFTNLEIVNSNKNIKEDIKSHANCKSADEDKVIERATQIVMYVSKNLKTINLVYGWFQKFKKLERNGNLFYLFCHK